MRHSDLILLVSRDNAPTGILCQSRAHVAAQWWHAGEIAKRVEQNKDDSSGASQSFATGFLLMFTTCLALQLEAPENVLKAVLERVHADRASLGMKQCRIISTTDGAGRAHQTWAAAFAGGEAKTGVDTADAAAAPNVASDVNLSFLNLGQQLQCAARKGVKRDESARNGFSLCPKHVDQTSANSCLTSQLAASSLLAAMTQCTHKMRCRLV